MTFRKPFRSIALGAGISSPLRIAVPLALAATMMLSASAQLSGKGTINGRVIDTEGAAVPDALVTITDNGTNKKLSIKSSGSGEYTFSLDPGKYTINASHEGFKTIVQENVNVNAHAIIGS